MATGGLLATLVIPAPGKRRGTAVVVLGGSQGGLDERGATAFAEAGFVALALAYFGVGSLPPALVEIPVEHVGAGLEWLRAQPEVGGRRVGLVGRSKGGELALRAAATYPADVSAVVGYTPSPVAWQGLPADRGGWREGPKSSWSVEGDPVPFLPFAKPRSRDLPRFALSMLAGNLALRPVYERALADDEARERALAPLEDTAGPILLISGGDDQMWPAVSLCELALARLARHEHAFPTSTSPTQAPATSSAPQGTGQPARAASPSAGARASTPKPAPTPGPVSSTSSPTTSDDRLQGGSAPEASSILEAWGSIARLRRDRELLGEELPQVVRAAAQTQRRHPDRVV